MAVSIQPYLDFFAPLLLGFGFGLVVQQLRSHLRQQRIHRITMRLLEY